MSHSLSNPPVATASAGQLRWQRLQHAFQREGAGPLARLWPLLLALWLLTLTVTPIKLWITGGEGFPLVATLGVLAQALASLAALALGWQWSRLLIAALATAVFTWSVEAVGTATGFPFGAYDYTTALQPQLLDVPLLIPFAWLMMLLPAWGVAAAILGSEEIDHPRPWRYRLQFALVAAAAVTAWDLYLDPQMVAKSLWFWESPGTINYFGIPFENFAGWLATGFIITLLLRPTRLPRLRLMVIYTLTWVFQAIGLGLIWGQPGPALMGFLVMGVFALLAWRRELRRIEVLP